MTSCIHRRYRLLLITAAGLQLLLLPPLTLTSTSFAQDSRSSLTPFQLVIDKQQRRLSSAEIDERRDAVLRLGALHNPAASRAALVALSDVAPIVRATAVAAILSLPAAESAAALIPLLNDKDEFVREEASYALGKTGSASAVAPLIERLMLDKKHGVRGAAAVALGDIGDEAAVVSLAQLLRPELNMGSTKKKKSNENVLVLRAAAHSLGQIGSRAGLPALLAALQDDKNEDDVRREAALALGMIGDPAALPALSALSSASDPYLSRAAHEASRKISNRQTARPQDN